MKKQNKKEVWEESFYEKFSNGTTDALDRDCFDWKYSNNEAKLYKDIKQFISILLSQERKKVVNQIIDEMANHSDWYCPKCYYEIKELLMKFLRD